MAFPNPILSPFTAINASGFSNATWNTGIASGAPAGATGMAVLLVGAAGGGTTAREFRKTGSADNFVSDNCPQGQQILRFVGLNGSGQFDYYSGAGAPGDLIYPLCYFGTEVTFPTSIIAMGSTLTTSYATYSTGGNAPAGLAAVFAIHGSTDYNSYFRHPSSADDFANGNEGVARRDWFCALDGSQQYAGKGGATGLQPYLVCYFTSNITTNITAVTRTPGTAGSYQNLSTSGDTSPIAQLFHMHSPSTTVAFQLSGQGSSGTAPNVVPCGTLAGAAMAFSPAQANIANTALAISELAYFTSNTPIVAWLV